MDQCNTVEDGSLFNIKVILFAEGSKKVERIILVNLDDGMSTKMFVLKKINCFCRKIAKQLNLQLQICKFLYF